jgi:hypothetical protein
LERARKRIVPHRLSRQSPAATGIFGSLTVAIPTSVAMGKRIPVKRRARSDKGAVCELELFHGAVLAKLAQSQHALTLRMIETQPREGWSTYRINDSATLMIKYSAKSRMIREARRARAWYFSFAPVELQRIRDIPIWLALVCGGAATAGLEAEICMLDPRQACQMLSGRPLIAVKRLGGDSLRVVGASALAVPRSRLDHWQVPGTYRSESL